MNSNNPQIEKAIKQIKGKVAQMNEQIDKLKGQLTVSNGALQAFKQSLEVLEKIQKEAAQAETIPEIKDDE